MYPTDKLFKDCKEIDVLNDPEIVLFQTTLKPKNQDDIKEHIQCLSCSVIRELQMFLDFTKEIYDTKKAECDEEFYNKRRLWQKEMRPFKYVLEFNKELENYLDKLKKVHSECFGECKLNK